MTKRLACGCQYRSEGVGEDRKLIIVPCSDHPGTYDLTEEDFAEMWRSIRLYLVPS
jgi:hypothetical protein